MTAYPELFSACGIEREAVLAKLDATFDTLFHRTNERFYFEMGADMGYLMDTGNIDARTEGMSYGMMMCVQRDEKELFDRLWRFSKRYMWHSEGPFAGYFAWSVAPDGVKNAQGPAPDGEEYFALALFFASHRWGDGVPPLDYGAQARDILSHCLHQPLLAAGGNAMWDEETALIKFTPDAPFSDPSYHLPHFYELFARWANEEDRPFWKKAAQASRAYLARACHPVTGLAAEYAHYDGTPETAHGHEDFYSDAYRVAMNIGLDAAWFGKTEALSAVANNLQAFLHGRAPYQTYAIDGTELAQPALHPIAVTATTAAASLAATAPLAREWVLDFWNTPLRTGERRYYDNCLSFFCLLMLAGEYRIF